MPYSFSNSNYICNNSLCGCRQRDKVPPENSEEQLALREAREELSQKIVENMANNK